MYESVELDLVPMCRQARGGSNGNQFSAIELVLEWCVQTFSMSVVNGNPTTKKLEAFHTYNTIPGEYLTARPSAGDQYTIVPNTQCSFTAL